jgi:hypothetical protein
MYDSGSDVESLNAGVTTPLRSDLLLVIFIHGFASYSLFLYCPYYEIL